MRRRSDCLVCKSDRLRDIIRLDGLPVSCNTLHLNLVDARSAPTGEFVASFCDNCGHLFNSAFDVSKIAYGPDYETSLHFSPTFSRYARELVERLVRTYDLYDKVIVEIGCGQAEFLNSICERGANRGVGFDTSFEPGRHELVRDVSVVNEWYSSDYGAIKPDFLVCRHVLEHVAEPLQFLSELRTHPGTTPNTRLYFEVPNAMRTLRDLAIWDLIYEHVSYFSAASLRHVFTDAGFDVLRIEETFGGQYLSAEARPSTGVGASEPAAVSSEVGAIGRHIAAFAENHARKVAAWSETIARFAPGSRFALWGAGSKGVTFLNVVPQAAQAKYIVDRNPRKQGRFVPRTGTPVVAPSYACDSPPEYMVVMNELYLNEIIDDLTRQATRTEVLSA